MRRRWIARGVLTLACVGVLAHDASAQQLSRPPGSRQADRHNPFSERYIPMTPGGHLRQNYPSKQFRASLRWSFGSRPFLFNRSFGWGGYRDWYDDWYDDWYRDFGDDFLWWQGPPVAVGPPMFGPEAAAAVAGNPQVQPNAAMDNRVHHVGPPQPQFDPNKFERHARARRLISQGETHFAAQRYTDAQRVFRQASRVGSDLAVAQFRYGQVLIAMGRYAAASEAFQLGIDLDPDWYLSDFRFETLYDGNQLAYQSHGNDLMKAANDNPDDGDVMFLVGLWLYFGNDPQRADRYFERAHQLGINGRLMAGFREVLAERALNRRAADLEPIDL